MIDLWGNVDPHILHSIALLKNNEPFDGYYLAFSGGKDSIVVHHICQQAGVKFDAHFRRAMEPPEVIYFIRQHYPDVIRHLPKKSMWKMIRDHGIYPLRTIRYCCSELKELGGEGRTIVTGVRRAEGTRRKNRQEFEKYKKSWMLAPILHWTDEQVWKYIKDNDLPYPSLYDEGFRRVGCVMCPCSSPQQMQKEAERWPKIANAYQRAGARFFDPDLCTTWKTAQDMYDWWISGKTFGKDDGQGELEW